MTDHAARARRRVLVTGCTGQIGGALIASAPAWAEVRGTTHAEFDIADADAIARAFARHRPNVVINAAAYTAVDLAESEPEKAFRINADGPAALAREAARAGVALVHLSSDFVFDGAARAPYACDARVGPLSVYGASKAAGEARVRARSPEALIVRTSWVYAASGRNFVRTMLRMLAQPGAVRVVDDQIGIPTHAGSFARALWPLVESGATGTCHLTDAGATSWHGFAVAIGEEAQRIGLLDRAAPVLPIPTTAYPTPARRPAFSVLDSSAAWSRLGRSAPHWRSELRAMLADIRGVAA